MEEESSGADVEQEVLQRNFYYSFGMKMQGPWEELQPSTEQHYLYNGKENNPELGLDWLSFGFREYDPVIARFPSVDPIADNFAHVSGFNYAENSPIRHIDLWGLQAIDIGAGLNKVMAHKYGTKEQAQDYNDLQQKEGLGTIAGIGLMAATTAGVAAGTKATVAFLANEAKDEGLSYATNGWYDFFDITKQGRKVILGHI